MLYRSMKAAAGLLVVVKLLFFTTLLAADEIFSEQDLLEDLPVVAATRLPQEARDLPVSITVFGRSEIAAAGIRDIPEIIRLVPGFRVGKVNANYYSVVGHGPGDQLSRHLQILIDGRPVFSPFLSTVDWSALPIVIDDIERIEVMRGPSASVYGANAYNGVINIITSRPADHDGVYVRTLTGEQGTAGVHLRYGFSTAKMSHAISVNYRDDDEGFTAQHDGRRYGKLFYRGSLQASLNDEIDIQIGVIDGFGEEPELNPAFIRERERNNQSNYQYLQWRHSYDNGDEMQLRAYHNYEYIDDRYNTLLLSDAFMVPPALIPALTGGQPDQALRFGFFNGRNRRLGLEYQRTSNFRDARFVWGFAMTQDRLESDILFYGKGVSEDSSQQVFGSMEWFIAPQLSLNAGGLVEHSNGISPRLSPRLSLNYRADEHHSFRIGAARSYRMQTAYEKDAFVVSTFADGSPFDYVFDYRDYDQPENVTSFELAHVATFPEYSLGFDWRLYRDRYRGVLASIKDRNYTPLLGATDAEIAGNAGEYLQEGFEFQLKYKPSPQDFIAVQYSYAEIDGVLQNQVNPEGFLDLSLGAPGVPRNMYSILASKSLPWDLQLSAVYSKVDEVRWYALGDTVPGYDRLDLRLARDFRVGSSEARAELLVENSLDEHYQNFRNVNLAESVFLLRLSFWQR